MYHYLILYYQHIFWVSGSRKGDSLWWLSSKSFFFSSLNKIKRNLSAESSNNCRLFFLPNYTHLIISYHLIYIIYILYIYTIYYILYICLYLSCATWLMTEWIESNKFILISHPITHHPIPHIITSSLTSHIIIIIITHQLRLWLVCFFPYAQ